MDLDDAVRRVLEGDASSYEAVVRACQRSLRSFIAYSCPSAHQVDELAQRTFVWAYEHLGDYRVGTRLDVWLKSIARKMILTELQAQRRDEQRRRTYLQVLQARRSESLLAEESPDRSELLRRCVEELPDHARALVFDFYRERKSVGELARAQGRGAGAVKTSLFRVRQVLRRCVESKRGVRS